MHLIPNDREIFTRQLHSGVGVLNGYDFYVLSSLVKKGSGKLSTFKKNLCEKKYFYLVTPKFYREKSLLIRSFLVQKHTKRKYLKAETQVPGNEIGVLAEVRLACQSEI